jgi:hypothetical protein
MAVLTDVRFQLSPNGPWLHAVWPEGLPFTIRNIERVLTDATVGKCMSARNRYLYIDVSDVPRDSRIGDILAQIVAERGVGFFLA